MKYLPTFNSSDSRCVDRKKGIIVHVQLSGHYELQTEKKEKKKRGGGGGVHLPTLMKSDELSENVLENYLLVTRKSCLLGGNDSLHDGIFAFV